MDVIAGVNLPLLVKLAKIRGSEPLADAVNHAAAAGRKYISAGGAARRHGAERRGHRRRRVERRGPPNGRRAPMRPIARPRAPSRCGGNGSGRP